MGVIGTRPLATCAWLGVCVLAGAAAPSEADDEAERCAALIEAFDEIVLTRFDHRLLALEDFELDEARALRREAAADCAAGRYRFGLQAIEEALRTIGAGPLVAPGETPG
jgi:hypothetical protein